MQSETKPDTPYQSTKRRIVELWRRVVHYDEWVGRFRAAPGLRPSMWEVLFEDIDLQDGRNMGEPLEDDEAVRGLALRFAGALEDCAWAHAELLKDCRRQLGLVATYSTAYLDGYSARLRALMAPLEMSERVGLWMEHKRLAELRAALFAD